jgi:FkbM family methyltransferase
MEKNVGRINMITCKTRLENFDTIYVDCWNTEGEKNLTLSIYDVSSNFKIVDYKFGVIDYIQVWSRLPYSCFDNNMIDGFKIILTNDLTKEIEFEDIILIRPYSSIKFKGTDKLSYPVILALNANYLETFRNFENDLLNIKNDKVLLDLGSSIGLFTAYALKQNPKLKSICVELNPIFHEICIETFKDNPNVIPINAAIYKTSNEIINVNSRSENLCDLGNNIIGDIYGDQPLVFKTNTISLEDIIKSYSIERVSLLKVDIEGYEYEIFENLTEDCLNKIDKILLEFHPSKNLKDRLNLIDKLIINGFKFKSLSGDINYYSTHMFTLFFYK